MSSMTRSIIRQAQRNRESAVARRLCPDCKSVLKAKEPGKFVCKRCNKLFVRKRWW